MIVTNRKKINPAVIAIVVVILVLGATGLGFAMKMNTSPKALYLKAEAISWEKDFEPLQKSFDFADQMLQTDGYTMESDLSAKLDMEGASADPMLSKLQEEINRLSFHMVTSESAKNKSSYNKIVLKQDQKDVLSFELMLGSEKSGIRSTELYDQTFFVKNKEFGQLMRQLDPSYQDIESLPNNPVTYDIFALKDDEKKHLTETYGKLLYDQLKEENFVLTEDGFKLEKDGETHTLDKISLKLSNKELQTILTAVLTEMKNDQTLYQMINERAQSFVLAAGDPSFIYNEEEFSKGYQEIFEEMLNGVKNMPETIDLVSNVYINSDRYIEKREISLILDKDAQVQIETTNMPLKDNKKWSMVDMSITDSAKEKVGFNIEQMDVGKPEEMTFNGEAKTYGTNDVLKATYSGNIKGDQTEFTYDVSYKDTSVVSGKANFVEKYAENVNELKSSFNFNFDLSGQKVALDINYDYKVDLANMGIDFEKQFENGIEAIQVQPEQWTKILDEVVTNGYQILEQTGFIDLYEIFYAFE